MFVDRDLAYDLYNLYGFPLFLNEKLNVKNVKICTRQTKHNFRQSVRPTKSRSRQKK